MANIRTSNGLRVLAIDPGYERMGVAVIESPPRKKEELIYSNCFKTSSKLPYHVRLKMIGEEMVRLIDEFKPHICATETLFFTKNQKTAMMVAGARGVVLFTAASHELLLYEYAPLQIKIAITGYGKSDKKHVAAMIEKLIDVHKDITYDDEYDAIAIGLTCIASEKSPVKP